MSLTSTYRTFDGSLMDLLYTAGVRVTTTVVFPWGGSHPSLKFLNHVTDYPRLIHRFECLGVMFDSSTAAAVLVLAAE